MNSRSSFVIPLMRTIVAEYVRIETGRIKRREVKLCGDKHHES